jgi:hypothetical protein
MRKKHGFTPKYPDVQASTTTMNKHPYSGCHYKRDSGSTPAGMNNLHTRGPTGQQTPSGSPATTTSAPMTAATYPPTPQRRTAVAPKRTDRSSLPSSPQNENGTVPEHGRRPRGVRCVVRPPGTVGGAGRTWTWPAHARHDRHPCGGWAATLCPSSGRWHRKQRQSRSGRGGQTCGSCQLHGRRTPFSPGH